MPIPPITLRDRHLNLSPCHTWKAKLFSKGRCGIIFNVCQHPPPPTTRCHRGWHALLEKKELHQAADILEKNRIGSETDVSELEQHDFSDLESRGLLHVQNLKRWCEAGGKMLPSWSTTPAAVLIYRFSLTYIFFDCLIMRYTKQRHGSCAKRIATLSHTTDSKQEMLSGRGQKYFWHHTLKTHLKTYF